MPKLYFKNDKTQKLYEIVSLDKEKGVVKLKGQDAQVEFEEPYDKERFQRLGYSLVKVDDPG